ncbi:GNAT family N-acetyltransferase [Streptomyces sp. M10(2022)]
MAPVRSPPSTGHYRLHDLRAHGPRRPDRDTPDALRDRRTLRLPGRPPPDPGPTRRADRPVRLRRRPGHHPEADFGPPHGLFLIAHVDEEAVGCGGVRLLGECTAEIKRMYVSGEARGYGIGRYLLEHLERHAANRGHSDHVGDRTAQHRRPGPLPAHRLPALPFLRRRTRQPN